jgi:predicted GNAT family N-acyltransferase
MHKSATFNVEVVNWQDASAALRAVRSAVFIHEQRIPEDQEWDEVDASCVHVLATTIAGEPIGTGRLLPDGHIGRMAVLKSWRGQGVGGAILRALLTTAEAHGHTGIELSAQKHAIGFYRGFGFEVTGTEYLEVGIRHRAMRFEFTQR